MQNFIYDGPAIYDKEPLIVDCVPPFFDIEPEVEPYQIFNTENDIHDAIYFSGFWYGVFYFIINGNYFFWHFS